MKNIPIITTLFESKKDLPFLIEQTDWDTKFVDYDKPFVQRMYRRIVENRMSIHSILQCSQEEAYFHAHDYASAMMIFDGIYRMAIGYKTNKEDPKIDDVVTLYPGEVYYMDDPNQFHSVFPTTKKTLTMMVTGKPWELPFKPTATKVLGPLDIQTVEEMRQNLRDCFNTETFQNPQVRNVFERYEGIEGFYALDANGKVVENPRRK